MPHPRRTGRLRRRCRGKVLAEQSSTSETIFARSGIVADVSRSADAVLFWSPTAANATRILFVGRANAGYDLGVLDVETCDPWPNTMIPSIGRCGVPPCECCDLAMREMGLLAPCA